MKLFLRLIVFFLLLSCGTSPSEKWLSEYQILLQKGAEIYNQDPYSQDMRLAQQHISAKEAEMDQLLQTISIQEQMSFLSRYYDLRVNYFYKIQNQ